MKLDVPARPIGPFDCAPVLAALARLDESAWQADRARQTLYENVHAQTQSLILRLCEGWPVLALREGAPPAPLGAAAMALVEQVLAHQIAKGVFAPGGLLLRVVLARLPAGAAIPTHRDAHPSFHIAHRVHVPLLTNPDVLFIVGRTRLNTRPGWAFEIDNLASHSVRNDGARDRVHLIFDYAPRLPEGVSWTLAEPDPCAS